MGKLLGRIFKEDIKSTILWLILPLVLALVFASLLKVFGENPLVMIGMGLTMAFVVIGPFVALVSVAINDYDRFYGKYSSFYSAIPIETGSILGARFINYILMTIIASLFAFAYFMVFVNLANGQAIYISDIFEPFKRLLSEIGVANLASIVLYMIIMLVTNIIEVIFAITAGSSRIFGRPSKLKVVLVFMAVSIIVGLIFVSIQANSAVVYENSLYIDNNLSNIANAEVHSKGYQITIAPIAYNLIIDLLLVAGTYYLHDKKLSVA
ncbi:hypothetical protein [Anaerococcus urinomassiliensis]|uniref:hypothetical protein n=1 Tax=Anaerococcus urinomassiliensis TaxID=1745712 RepID=UPI00093B8175|nr:hypothetical protein [Anaerococcus urinomassiliensis]